MTQTHQAPLNTPGPVQMDDISGEVAIVGIGESAYAGATGRTSQEICFDAIDAALKDSGLRPEQIDGIMVRGGMDGQISPQGFQEHYGTTTDIWFCEEGGAMTWAATAPYEAAKALREGRATTILNVFGVDWASQRSSGGDGHASYHLAEAMKANAEVVFGFIPQPIYFAHIARRHMMEHGTTAAQLGEIAVTFRQHANGHPDAVMKDKRLELDDYLQRPMLVDPLRVEDCCLVSDGAAAYIMVSADRADTFPNPPVIVEGVGHGISEAGSYFAQQPKFMCSPQIYSAPGAFAMAGIEPQQIDVLALYDPFTILALIQIEDMGFCAKGEGGRFVEGGRLHFQRPRSTGGLPTNTHGGLLSHAYVLGIAHVVELVRQLRGTAANQVANCQFAAYGGYTGESAGTLVLSRRPG